MRVSLLVSFLFLTLQCLSVYSIDTTSSGAGPGPDAPDIVTERVKPGGFPNALVAEIGDGYTMCDWYTEYLFGAITPINSYSWLQLVLDAAFNGYEEDGDTAPGFKTSSVLQNYFNGNVDFRSGEETPNYNTDNTAYLALREKLIDYFARPEMLSCTSFVNRTYEGGRQYEYVGNINLQEVHKRAKIGKTAFETFNAIVIGAMESYYMEAEDSAAVAVLLSKFSLGSGQNAICTQYDQETPAEGCTLLPLARRYRIKINMDLDEGNEYTMEDIRNEMCMALGFSLTGEECAKIHVLYLWESPNVAIAHFIVDFAISDTNSGDNTALEIATSLQGIIRNPNHPIYNEEGYLSSTDPSYWDCVATSTVACKSCATITISNVILVVLALLAYMLQ